MTFSRSLWRQALPRLDEYNRAQQAGALSSYEIAAEQLKWRQGQVEQIRVLRSER